MRHVKWILPMLVALLAACAQQPVHGSDSNAKQSRHAIDYAKYVQGSVPWFHFSSLYSWDSNKLGSVAVWTGPREAYLLTLAGPCMGLLTATGFIGLTSHDHMVSSNQDAVIAGGHHCQIMRIERLDAKAIRALRSKPKAADGKDN